MKKNIKILLTVLVFLLSFSSISFSEDESMNLFSRDFVKKTDNKKTNIKKEEVKERKEIEILPSLNKEDLEKKRALEHIRKNKLFKGQRRLNSRKSSLKENNISKITEEVVRELAEEAIEEDKKGDLKDKIKEREKQFNFPKSSHFKKEKHDSIISLVISSTPKKDYENALYSLTSLHSKHSIPIAEVFVIHENFTPSSILESVIQKKSRVLKMLEESGAKIKPRGRVPKRLKISTSPTWIIRYKNEDYVFEGLKDPNELFNATGEFIGHKM